MDLGIRNRVAVVTGGSHGIGRATARGLAREGAQVVICGRTAETLAVAAETIAQETTTQVIPVRADVTVKEDLELLVATTIERLGRLDILVNNADATTHEGSFFELTDADWMEMLDIKLLAVIRLIRLAAPHMQRRGWGMIVNIGGPASRRIFNSGWGKGAAQAGQINLTKKLADILGRDGVTVNLIEPGAIWTDGKTVRGMSRAEIRHHEVERAAEREGISFDEMNERLLGELVIGRRVEPEDIADIVLFLASERSGAITGEVLLADGGETRAVRF